MDEFYKMILVDDEDEVRGRISSKISHDSGFKVVAAAGNGYDALELIEKHNPHVVLTDIKMPFVDGIELARTIKRDFPTVRVAFITGFDEFEYAREAVELHVTSYLTKPVTQNDISNFLDKLKLELDEEFKEKYNLDTLRQRYEQSLPLIIDNYFTSFLVFSQSGRNEDIENLRHHGISLDDREYIMAFVQTERDQNNPDVVEYEKLKLSVRSVIQSILERHGYTFYSFHFNNGIALVIKENSLNFLRKVDSVFYEMVKMVEQYLGVYIDIGVSKLHKGFSELRTAYEESSQALGFSRFLNAGRIVYIDQLEKDRPKTLSLSDTDINDIVYNVKFGSDRDIRNVMESVKLNALRDSKTVTNFRPYIITMVNILVNFCDSTGVDLDEVLEEDVLEKMTRFRNLESMFDWVLSVILKLRELNLKNKMTNSQRMLDNAINYMEKNFTDPKISMESVCDEMGISVSYLSLLFKKEKQTTFVKYLTMIRLERAKELLGLTSEKIIDIAGKCGYNEVYYFSHSFKKYTGVSPKKYREEVNSN
ncbi:MAG: response regulator [Spirochaetales bacterium]|nr:response regulator [Spirochaetales bacterium]